MGVFCCVDRDKPPEDPLPVAPPSEGFLTKKPKVTIKKTVLLVASDLNVLDEMLQMLSRSYQVTHSAQVATLNFEDWSFDILCISSADSIRLATSANLAKVVFFFFDLQDSRSLEAMHARVTTYCALTRKDSVKYFVGYNPPSRLSSEAAEAASDVKCIYIEVPFPKESSHQLVEKMIG